MEDSSWAHQTTVTRHGHGWVPVAVNHGNSSILGFCDGHAQVRKWRNPSTKDHINKLIEQDGNNYGTFVPQDAREDLDYMVAGSAYR